MIMEDKGGCVWNAACENFFEKKYRAVIENSFCFLQAGLRSRGGEEPAPRACGCRTTLRVGSAWNISAFRGAGRTLVVQANRLGGGPTFRGAGRVPNGRGLGERAALWHSESVQTDVSRGAMRTTCFFIAPYCRVVLLVLLSLSLAGCGLMDFGGGGGGTRGTKTYTVRGKTYRPYLTADGYREDGIASWYGKDFHGKKTANGERYNMYSMTAAHKLLPLGTKVRVTHLRTGRSIVVRVNDRGPFVGNRIIDLSYAGARELGIIGTGTARVRVEALDGFDGVGRPRLIIDGGPRLFDATAKMHAAFGVEKLLERAFGFGDAVDALGISLGIVEKRLQASRNAVATCGAKQQAEGDEPLLTVDDKERPVVRVGTLKHHHPEVDGGGILCRLSENIPKKRGDERFVPLVRALVIGKPEVVRFAQPLAEAHRLEIGGGFDG